MTYHSIYKIVGLCLNMKYIVMILEIKIQYTLIKSNMPLQRNPSSIFCHLLNNISEIVKEKLISHSTHVFAKYVKMYFLQNYQLACSIQNCYVCMQN